MPAADTLMFTRVVLVRTARGTGAGFLLDRRKRQWLVTAGHLVPPDPIVEFDLVLANSRATTALRRVPPTDTDSIAVFRLDEPLLPKSESYDPSNNGLLVGQDVHLFGYPLIGFGAWNTETGGALAFVRRGCMGGTMSHEGTRTLLIDAISDRGMSGGPATFAHDSNGKAHIAGVVVDTDADHGTTWGEQPQSFPQGITRVVSIDHVTDVIDEAKRR